MKNPCKLAEDFFAHNDYNEFSADEVFVIGYKAAHNRVVQVIKKELETIQVNKNFSTYVVNPDIESVVESLLNKIKEL